MSDDKAGSGEVFDVDRIRRLVELMKEHDLSEVDLRESDQRIRLCRGSEAPTIAMPPQPMMAAAAPQPAPAAPPPAQSGGGDSENIEYITSPSVGTFYSRANPESDPFVKPGDYVDEGSVVCIIEAMKVFNELPAEIRGKIVAVLVDDGEPVDHGMKLFKVDTSA